MTATNAKPEPNPYLRTKVMTASPAELRMMLLDGAVRFLEQARDGLERKDYEASYNGFTRCQRIVTELLNALRPDDAPELCRNLSSLYTFIYLQLVRACTERDVKVADEMLGLLRYERETWQMLMTQQAGADPAPAAEPVPADDETPAAAPLSITG